MLNRYKMVRLIAVMGTPAIKIVHNKFKNVPKDVQAVI
jgi:hypothetical protein